MKKKYIKVPVTLDRETLQKLTYETHQMISEMYEDLKEEIEDES